VAKQKWTMADDIWMEIFKDRGVKITKEWIQSEIDKCRMSHEYFINQYVLIRNRAENNDALAPGTLIYGDVIDIKLYDIQCKYLNTVHNYQNTAAIKTRQSGVSLTTGLYLLKRATFENNKEFICISKSERESIKFLDEIKFSQMHLPFFLRRRQIGNMKKMQLGNAYNSSILRALPGGKDAGRSYTATVLVLDETAFIEGVENIWTAAAPTLTTTGGKAVLISTPWEDEGLFFDIVGECRNNPATSGFKLVEVPWRSIPGRDAAWYERECAKLQHVEDKIKTELDMQFISRGTKFFNIKAIDEKLPLPQLVTIVNESLDLHSADHQREFEELTNAVNMPMTGIGSIFEFPQPGSTYIVGHDPAEDGTSSCNGVSILKVDGFPTQHPKIVFEWRGKASVMNTMIDLCRHYNNAKACIEKNRGYAVIMHFISSEAESFLLQRPNGDYGLLTTTASRQILLKILNKFLVADVDYTTPLTREEANGFVRNSAGKLKGKKWDDALFSLGIALLGLVTYPDLLLPNFEDMGNDERLKLLGFLKEVTTDKNLHLNAAERFVMDLRSRLFGNTKPTDTNQIEKIRELIQKKALPI